MLLDLLDCPVAGDNHHARLCQLCLLLKHVVARPLLGDHELDGQVVADAPCCGFTFESNKLIASVKRRYFKVSSCHYFNLVVFADADDRGLDTIRVQLLAIVPGLIKDRLFNFLFDFTNVCSFTLG